MEEFSNCMFTFFYNIIFNTNFCFKYFWLFLLVAPFKLFAEELLPYPYLTYSSSIQFKGDEKFQLNSFIKLDNAVAHVLLDANTKLKLVDASFSLKKLPDYYLLEISKGSAYLTGNKKVLISYKDTKIFFYEGETLFSVVDEKLKLLSNKKTKLKLDVDNKLIKLKENSFYLIQKTILESSYKINFDNEISNVLDLSNYRRLIVTETNEQTLTIEKNKGFKIFCLEGDKTLSINNWFVNTDKSPLLKKVLSEKYLKICKDKFSNIIDAGEYETDSSNCLYINNYYCQRINISSSVILIRLAKVLLTGYESVSIKKQDQSFYQVDDKWLFLSPGTYVFKLGKTINNATIYEEKKINIKPGQTSRISDLKI